MSRTTPDPVFATAAQAELERRIRARRSTSTASRSRRPWVMELAAVAGVLALVGGVALGVAALRPSLDRGGAPIGSVTQAASPEPTVDPSASPLVPPAIAVPPTTPPTAPATGAPPTSKPTSTPTAPTPPSTAPPVSGGALVGPTGAQQRSSAAIRTWALSLGYGDVWAEQAVLDASCMAGQGFLHDPEFMRAAGVAEKHAGLSDAQYQAYQVALYGPETTAPYDWRTAGCHGRSVHLTGQDGNH
jgi:hypothetical protein